MSVVCFACSLGPWWCWSGACRCCWGGVLLPRCNAKKEICVVGVVRRRVAQYHYIVTVAHKLLARWHQWASNHAVLRERYQQAGAYHNARVLAKALSKWTFMLSERKYKRVKAALMAVAQRHWERTLMRKCFRLLQAKQAAYEDGWVHRRDHVVCAVQEEMW